MIPDRITHNEGWLGRLPTRMLHLGRSSLGVLVAVSTLACININVHFPRAEIRDAADQIIDEVRPVEPETAQNDEDETGGGAALDPRWRTSGRSAILVTLPADAAAAVAQEDDIDKDPVVRKVKESLKERFKKLKTFYDKGAIGESLKGLIELRDLDDLSLKEKLDVKKLREAENSDRMNLYRRIAVLKGVPDKVEQVQEVFATSWIAKARKGWWVQKEDKGWVKKEKDPEKKDDEDDGEEGGGEADGRANSEPIGDGGRREEATRWLSGSL